MGLSKCSVQAKKKDFIHDYCNSGRRLKSTLRKQKAEEVVGTGVSFLEGKEAF